MKLEPGSRENPDEGYRSRYTHDEEQATPNYYAVRLQDYGVKAEMTAGLRSGMFRFTYPESEKSFIMVVRMGQSAHGKRFDHHRL